MRPAMNQKLAVVTLVASLGASCAAPEDETEFRADLNEITVVDPTTCIDPRNAPTATPPATLNNPNDDDRFGIQWAIDQAKITGRPVCLAPGRYDVEVDHAVGAEHIDSLKIWNADGLVMVGAGPRSVIAYKGTGIRANRPTTSWGPGDWWLISVRGTRDTHLGYFKVDGTARRDTEEQTHGIHLSHLPENFLGNATAISTSNTQIDHVDFNDPQPARPAGLQACSTGPTDPTMCLHPNHPDRL